MESVFTSSAVACCRMHVEIKMLSVLPKCWGSWGSQFLFLHPSFLTFLHIRLTLSKKQTFPRMSLKVKDVSRPYWISSDTLLGLLNVLYQWPLSLFSAVRIWSAFPSELNVEVLHSVSSPVVVIPCWACYSFRQLKLSSLYFKLQCNLKRRLHGSERRPESGSFVMAFEVRSWDSNRSLPCTSKSIDCCCLAFLSFTGISPEVSMGASQESLNVVNSKLRFENIILISWLSAFGERFLAIHLVVLSNTNLY